MFISTSPTWRKVFTELAELRDLPSACAHFVPLLGVFRLADRAFAPPPESQAPCWLTVATVYPLGNCDSLRPETSLSYLTQLGTVSHSFLAAEFLFALLTMREHRQRNW